MKKKERRKLSRHGVNKGEASLITQVIHSEKSISTQWTEKEKVLLLVA